MRGVSSVARPHGAPPGRGAAGGHLTVPGAPAAGGLRLQLTKGNVMTSKLEKDRKAILERLNNQGRRLEKQSPTEAAELNAELEKVVEWLKLRLTK
jgi:hypothetical protein